MAEPLDFIPKIFLAHGRTASGAIIPLEVDSTGKLQTTNNGETQNVQIYYVGKHGNDTNSGKTINTAFLTFGKAITAASGDTPSATNGISIVCFDGGQYTENIAVPSFVSVVASNATLVGNHTIADDSNITARVFLANSGTAITKSTGSKSASIVFSVLTVTGSAIGIVCTSGTIEANGQALSLDNGFGIGSTSTQNVYLKCNYIYISGTGTAIGAGANSNIIVFANEVSDAGSGTGLLTIGSNAMIEAVIGNLNCSAALNCGTGTIMNVVTTAISGTKTVNGTANLHEALENIKRSEPGGIEDRSLSTLTFTDGTRTLSIQPTGANFAFWVKSIRHVTTGDTFQIAPTEGLHYVYYDDDGALTEAVNPSNADISAVIRTKCIVSVIYWDNTNSKGIYIGEERHGITMDGVTHAYEHFHEGLRYTTGLALNTFDADNGTPDNASAQFGSDLGSVSDEDLFISISAVTSTTGFPVFYRDGTSNWRKIVKAGYSVLTDNDTGVGSTGRLVYNLDTAGTWSTAVVSNNDFVLCHIFMTTEKDTPIIAIMGQAIYANIVAARTGANTEINNLLTAGLPTPEIRPLGTVLFQTSDSYTGSAVRARVRTNSDGNDYVDWRTSELIPGAGTAAHGSLSGLSNDDHTQYGLLAGRSGGQTLKGGTDSGDDLTLESTSNATKGDVISSDSFICNKFMGCDAEYDNSNSGSSKTIDWNNGNYQKVTMTDDCTFTFTAPTGKVGTMRLKLIQDGTGGHAATLPATVRSGGGFTLNTTNSDPNETDSIKMDWDGTNYDIFALDYDIK